MSKSKHSKAQIIAVLKQVEAGRTADDVVQERGVSKCSARSFVPERLISVAQLKGPAFLSGLGYGKSIRSACR
jgi:hypothetical protein